MTLQQVGLQLMRLWLRVFITKLLQELTRSVLLDHKCLKFLSIQDLELLGPKISTLLMELNQQLFIQELMERAQIHIRFLG